MLGLRTCPKNTATLLAASSGAISTGRLSASMAYSTPLPGSSMRAAPKTMMFLNPFVPGKSPGTMGL